MRKWITVLTCAALLGLGSTSAAAAQAYERVAQEETTEEDDGGTDYGWIGLLGLAGLAGLLGRNRRRDDDRVVVRDRTGGDVR